MLIINTGIALVGMVAVILIVIAGIGVVSFIVAAAKSQLGTYAKVQYKKGHILTGIMANTVQGLQFIYRLVTKTDYGVPLFGILIVALVIFVRVVTDTLTWTILVIAIIIDVLLVAWLYRKIFIKK